jgi:hypothetical protein
MKPFRRQVAWLVLLAVIFALFPPLSAWSQNQSTRTPDAAVQTAQTLKWKFGGNEAGSGSYTVRPDGTFESVTELNVVGQNIKSRLTGKMVNGLVSEFEMVTQQAGTEVKTSARDGKAQITVGKNSRTVDYKPSSVLFGNLHPILSQTWAKVLDPTKGSPKRRRAPSRPVEKNRSRMFTWRELARLKSTCTSPKTGNSPRGTFLRRSCKPLPQVVKASWLIRQRFIRN